MAGERRRVPRYFFSAQAEVQDSRTALRVSSRVGELGLHGCYLDMMNPFPAETLVSLQITAGAETLETNGRIVYSTPNVGSGTEFLEMSLKDRGLLERWLEQAAE